MHKCLSHRLYEFKAIHQAVSYSIKLICILKSYQFILLLQAFPVKPPKMFPPLFTTVTVGPLLSHLKWNAKAAKPSREARNSKRHSLFIGNQVFKTLRCPSFVSITDSTNSFGRCCTLQFVQYPLQLIKLSFCFEFLEECSTIWQDKFSVTKII